MSKTSKRIIYGVAIAALCVAVVCFMMNISVPGLLYFCIGLALLGLFPTLIQQYKEEPSKIAVFVIVMVIIGIVLNIAAGLLDIFYLQYLI